MNVFHSAVLVLLSTWCLSITPLYRVMPTVMDTEASHLTHEPSKIPEIMHGAEGNATVEYVIIH
jgi:hypothetical protein